MLARRVKFPGCALFREFPEKLFKLIFIPYFSVTLENLYFDITIGDGCALRSKFLVISAKTRHRFHLCDFIEG